MTRPVHEQIAEDRAHYLAHPSEDEWEEAPAPAQKDVKRHTGTMISVRLSASEADEIRAAAETAGLAVSAFIRKVVLDHVRARGGIYLNASYMMGNSSRVVSHVELQPGTPLSGGLVSASTLAVQSS